MKVYVLRHSEFGDIITVYRKKPRKIKETLEDTKGNSFDAIWFEPQMEDDAIIWLNYRTFKKHFGYVPKLDTCEEKELILK